MNGSRSWADHLIALFVTFHLAMVVVHLIPAPPATRDAVFEIPEVAQEVDRVVDGVHGTPLYDGTREELRLDLIEWVRSYATRMNDVAWVTEVYLAPIGSVQDWNMFGGNANQHPRVMRVEVRPQGETAFVAVQDGRWDGTPVAYRHRKVQRTLSLKGLRAMRALYAAHFAREWNALNPDRPAAEVRLSYAAFHTLPAADVKAGATSKPEQTVLAFTWQAP